VGTAADDGSAKASDRDVTAALFLSIAAAIAWLLIVHPACTVLAI